MELEATVSGLDFSIRDIEPDYNHHANIHPTDNDKRRDEQRVAQEIPNRGKGLRRKRKDSSNNGEMREPISKAMSLAERYRSQGRCTICTLPLPCKHSQSTTEPHSVGDEGNRFGVKSKVVNYEK